MVRFENSFDNTIEKNVMEGNIEYKDYIVLIFYFEFVT